jgi:hypothetical protein
MIGFLGPSRKTAAMEGPWFPAKFWTVRSAFLSAGGWPSRIEKECSEIDDD